MLKIYHSPGTRGFRVIWACEELGVPYEIEPVDFGRKSRAPRMADDESGRQSACDDRRRHEDVRGPAP